MELDTIVETYRIFLQLTGVEDASIIKRGREGSIKEVKKKSIEIDRKKNIHEARQQTVCARPMLSQAPRSRIVIHRSLARHPLSKLGRTKN